MSTKAGELHHDANDHALAVGQFAVHDEVVVARS
jgi:hypothetical protein